MARLAPILFMLVLFLVTASPTLAGRTLLISDYVRCDLSPQDSNWGSQGDGPTDYAFPRGGNVQLFDDDTFTFIMGTFRNGALPANTAFSCRMTCMGNLAQPDPRVDPDVPDGPNGPNDPVFVKTCGATDHHGVAKFKISNFRSDPEHSVSPGPGRICTGPLFEIFEEGKEGFGARCKNGFGRGLGAL